MARIRQNFFTGTLLSQLLAGATTVTSAALASLGVVASPDVAYLVIDPSGPNPEVVEITAHTSGNTAATIVRGQDGTTDRTWPVGTAVIQAPIVSDLDPAVLRTALGTGYTADLSATYQAHSSVLDGTTASFTTTEETKLSGIAAGAQVNAVASVDGATGSVVLTASYEALGVSARKAALWLPGSSGNYLSCPDSAALSVTGDLEIVVHAAADGWTPAAEVQFGGKYTTAGGQRSFAFGIDTSGKLSARFSSDGNTPGWGTTLSNAAASLVDGTAYWVKVTIDVDNGASGSTLKFYKAADASDEPSSWTQIGTDVTVATGGISIFDGTGVLEVGSIAVGTIGNFAGKIHRVIVRSGIGGTTVADLRTATPFGTRYRDIYTNIWTLNGTASAFTPASPS